MRFCAHSVGSHAAALVDEMTAPDVTSSPDRNDRADRHERIDIIEEIQNARVWAAVLQQHVVPSPLRARCHNKIAGRLFPLPASQIMSACCGPATPLGQCRRGISSTRAQRLPLHCRLGRSGLRLCRRQRSLIARSSDWIVVPA